MILTRRRVLAALAAAGGAGALTGTGTAAMFSDTERLNASLTTGTVDLVVEYDVLSGPGVDGPDAHGVVDGPRVSLPIGALDAAADAGSMRLTFALPQREGVVNNPAALWLVTDCPTPASTALAEAIQVTLSYADCETGAPMGQLTSGSLREVADDLRGGVRVDGDPTAPGTACLTDEVCLLVEYELVGYVGTESVDLPLWFAAIQCRHGTAENPFTGRETAPCSPADPCPCCRTLGKLEFEDGTQPGLGDSFAEPGTYAFTEGDTDYGLEIYDTVDKDGEETVGVAFRLVNLAGGPVPSLCTVTVKAGTGSEQYDRADGTSPDTTDLPGSDADGVVYAPDGKGISHVTVCICTTAPADECPGCVDTSVTTDDETETGGGNGGPPAKDDRPPRGDR